MARRRGKQNIQYEEIVSEPNKLSHLQPELLTEDVLKDLLRERGVLSTTMHHMTKDDLAGLFYKQVTPKPQRDLRENRRGKLLMKVRKKKERIIKDEGLSSLTVGFKGKIGNERVSATSVGNQNYVASQVPMKSSGLVNAIPSTAERLKPPPSCINTGRKTIKLGGGSSTPSSSSLNVIDRKTINISNSSTSSSNVTTPARKIIKLSESLSKISTLEHYKIVINSSGLSRSSGECAKRSTNDISSVLQKKFKTVEVENEHQKRKSDEVSAEPRKPPKLIRKPITSP